MHEYVPGTASQIIVTVGTLHNNHRNLRESSLQLRFIQFNASVLRRHVYLSILLLIIIPEEGFTVETLLYQDDTEPSRETKMPGD